MSVWRFNQKLPLPDDMAGPSSLPAHAQLMARHAKNLARMVNESLVIAGSSKVFDTRKSRISFCKEKLAELKTLTIKYPFIRLTELVRFEIDVAKIDAEIKALARRYANSDIISVMQFCATLQQRTPLRVLTRHGEIFAGLPNDPPIIARESWEGVWVAKLRTFREMGIDLAEPADGSMASGIGPISSDGGSYLKYLLATRQIVESANPIGERAAQLVAEVFDPKWNEFTHHRFHGPNDIVDYFFPRFLHCVSRLPFTAIEELERLGLDSPAALDEAVDSNLLAIRGIGPKILAEIRLACAAATFDRECVRIDRVER